MPEGDLSIEATLTIGADGRRSIVRERAGLTVDTFGAPIDVLWMRLSRRETDRVETLGVIRSGRVFVMLNRGDYWQCAFVIPKGGYQELNVLAPVLGRQRGQSIALPFPVKMLQRYPVLRRIPARLVGLGVRPEHVRTPNAFAGP